MADTEPRISFRCDYTYEQALKSFRACFGDVEIQQLIGYARNQQIDLTSYGSQINLSQHDPICTACAMTAIYGYNRARREDADHHSPSYIFQTYGAIYAGTNYSISKTWGENEASQRALSTELILKLAADCGVELEERIVR